MHVYIQLNILFGNMIFNTNFLMYTAPEHQSNVVAAGVLFAMLCHRHSLTLTHIHTHTHTPSPEFLLWLKAVHSVNKFQM